MIGLAGGRLFLRTPERARADEGDVALEIGMIGDSGLGFQQRASTGMFFFGGDLPASAITGNRRGPATVPGNFLHPSDLPRG